MTANLPIQDVIPELLEALLKTGRAVLQAPPGAGKTTVIPLEILASDLVPDRILMLEPRRLAARAAAERMAALLNQPVGQTVGYRIRGDAKTSSETRIEVVTEGILTRMIQSNPELPGVSLVIFDEFHERSLNADLALALCVEIAGALRDDLHLLVMSATLDAEPVADLMKAPIMTSEGRSFPVAIQYLDKPISKSIRLDQAVTDLTLKALAETEGGVLVFLPGEAEIRRVQARLSDVLTPEHVIRPLFGALPFAEQRAVIAPTKEGRKIVLATAIAETSLTIEDIRVVIDGGKARRARFDPSSGMSRLVTEPVTRAEATQRAGRAGRVAEGTCFRLWTKGEEGALRAHPPAEIEAADLASFALELALWGAMPEELPLLTQPSAASYAEAQTLLHMLGALDSIHRITEHGKSLANLPLHPRLAHLLTKAGPAGAEIAALLSDRDPLPRDASADLALRLNALRNPKGHANRSALSRINADAKRLAKAARSIPNTELGDAEMAALAYPDRIGLRRPGDAPRYVLSGGKGAIMEEHDPLSTTRLIVTTDLDGDRREAKIRQAIRLEEAELRTLYGDQIKWQNVCFWDKRTGKVIARQQERFGALILDDRIWKDAPDEAIATAMLKGIRDLGLRWSDTARLFAARVKLLRKEDESLPDMTDIALLEDAETWLLPHISGLRSAQDWKDFDILDALRARLSWEQLQRLDTNAPSHFITPLGRRIPIDYSGDHPEIALRLQEMFGQVTHPIIGGFPLRVTLLSPAGRPVQTTLDLPGFWASSYSDVRKDMRGKYPKHPWPEDPTQADPTLRAKRRK